MSLPSLSEGALLKIYQGGTVEKPIFQVLGYKKLANSDRYRVFVSDGQYSNSFSMLSTQMNSKIESNELSQFCLIRANNYNCNQSNGKKVLILFDISIVAPGSEVKVRIGDPVSINPDGSVSGEPKPVKRAADAAHAATPPAKRSPLTTPNSQSKPRSSILDSRPSQAPSDPSQLAVVPIGSLTPYQNKWTIKARVTHKSDIRRWSNSKGEGHLFSMDLLDETGEIRATAFKEQCDRYYNMIEVGKLYYITSCSLKPANKQYSSLKNDYEMTFRDSTEVIACNDSEGGNIPTISYDFVKIADMSQVPKDSVIDVLAVVKVCNDAATITSQRTGKELTKRDLTIIDQSATEVNLTIWGTNAETFEGAGNPVIAVKNAKVSDYNGVSLSCLGSSVLMVNPDMPQAHFLKGWYDSEGSTVSATSITQSGMRSGGADGGIGANLKTLGEVKQENLGIGGDGKPSYYSTSAYIVMFQKDRALYQACSRVNDGKSCNKKVLDQNNGLYRCEKCNVEMEEFNWRMVLSFSIADPTENVWVTCFQEQGEQILGKSVDELASLSQNSPDEFNKVFQESTFKHFNFRLSCKGETYNDEQKVRHTVRTVVPIEYNEYNKRLIKEIEDAGMEVPSKIDKSLYA